MYQISYTIGYIQGRHLLVNTKRIEPRRLNSGAGRLFLRGPTMLVVLELILVVLGVSYPK